jgi:ADP-heptose:LPS heptosyltransferase
MSPGTGHKLRQLGRLLRVDSAPLPTVWFNTEDDARVQGLIPAGRPIIAFAPTANWAPKIWPQARFVELFQRLSVPPFQDAVAAIIAGPGEREAALAKPVLEGLPNAIDLVSRLTLPEIAALLARSVLFVGNDSGLMHLAAASGAPTLGLFGPTNEEEYSPTGRSASALKSPDGSMEGISVDLAEEAARKLLHR